MYTAGPDAVAAMWSYISEKLLEAIPLEPDSEITGIMINSLCKVRLVGLLIVVSSASFILLL